MKLLYQHPETAVLPCEGAPALCQSTGQGESFGESGSFEGSGNWE